MDAPSNNRRIRSCVTSSNDKMQNKTTRRMLRFYQPRIKSMHAEKIILETDQQGNLLQIPKLPPNAQLEAIFLVLNQSPPPPKRRKPSTLIDRKGKIVGDIMAPAATEREWDALN